MNHPILQNRSAMSMTSSLFINVLSASTAAPPSCPSASSSAMPSLFFGSHFSLNEPYRFYNFDLNPNTSVFTITFISALIFQVAGFYLFRTFAPSLSKQSRNHRRGLSWVLTLFSSIVLFTGTFTLSKNIEWIGIGASHHQHNHSPTTLHSEPLHSSLFSSSSKFLVISLSHFPQESDLAVAYSAYFVSYLVCDLVLGVIHYRTYLDPLSGWIHHLGYLGVVSNATLQRNVSTLFAIGTPIEASTIFLAAGHIFPNLRSDILFAISFFLVRIVYPIILLPELYLNVEARLCWKVALMALLVHIHWFHKFVKQQIRYYHARRHHHHHNDNDVQTETTTTAVAAVGLNNLEKIQLQADKLQYHGHKSTKPIGLVKEYDYSPSQQQQPQQQQQQPRRITTVELNGMVSLDDLPDNAIEFNGSHRHRHHHQHRLRHLPYNDTPKTLSSAEGYLRTQPPPPENDKESAVAATTTTTTTTSTATTTSSTTSTTATAMTGISRASSMRDAKKRISLSAIQFDDPQKAHSSRNHQVEHEQEQKYQEQEIVEACRVDDRSVTVVQRMRPSSSSSSSSRQSSAAVASAAAAVPRRRHVANVFDSTTQPTLESNIKHLFMDANNHNNSHSTMSLPAHLPPECVHLIVAHLESDQDLSSLSTLLVVSRLFLYAALPSVYSAPFTLLRRSSQSEPDACARLADLVRLLLTSSVAYDDYSDVVKAMFDIHNRYFLDPAHATSSETQSRTTRPLNIRYLDYLRHFDNYFELVEAILPKSGIIRQAPRFQPYLEQSKLEETFEELMAMPESALTDNHFSLYVASLVSQEVQWVLCRPVQGQLQTIVIPVANMAIYLENHEEFRSLRSVDFHNNYVLIPPFPRGEKCDCDEEDTFNANIRWDYMMDFTIDFVNLHQDLFPDAPITDVCYTQSLHFERSAVTERALRCSSFLRLPLGYMTKLDHANWRSFTQHYEETDVSNVEEFEFFSPYIQQYEIIKQNPEFLGRFKSLRRMSCYCWNHHMFSWARKFREEQNAQEVEGGIHRKVVSTSSSTNSGGISKNSNSNSHETNNNNDWVLPPLEAITIKEWWYVVHDALEDLVVAFGPTLKRLETWSTIATRIMDRRDGEEEEENTRVLEIGQGWVLPKIEELALRWSQYSVKYDRTLLSRCPSLKVVDLLSESCVNDVAHSSACLYEPAYLPELKVLILQGLAVAEFHPKTLESAKELQVLKLQYVNGYRHRTQNAEMLTTVEDDDDDDGDKDNYKRIPQSQYRTGRLQPLSFEAWTWDWYLPQLRDLYIDGELCFSFQFRMLAKCPSLVTLTLDLKSGQETRMGRVLTLADFALSSAAIAGLENDDDLIMKEKVVEEEEVVEEIEKEEEELVKQDHASNCRCVISRASADRRSRGIIGGLEVEDLIRLPMDSLVRLGTYIDQRKALFSRSELNGGGGGGGGSGPSWCEVSRKAYNNDGGIHSLPRLFVHAASQLKMMDITEQTSYYRQEALKQQRPQQQQVYDHRLVYERAKEKKALAKYLVHESMYPRSLQQEVIRWVRQELELANPMEEVACTCTRGTPTAAATATRRRRKKARLVKVPSLRVLRLMGKWSISDKVLSMMLEQVFPNVRQVVEIDCDGFTVTGWIRTMERMRYVLRAHSSRPLEGEEGEEEDGDGDVGVPESVVEHRVGYVFDETEYRFVE
ncbi:hypothetical protein BG004_008299 [Podila humilis]|nr:hypothetical protein BG004_008299 [Podila humilis]